VLDWSMSRSMHVV
jgi:hypothetical protein